MTPFARGLIGIVILTPILTGSSKERSPMPTASLEEAKAAAVEFAKAVAAREHAAAYEMTAKKYREGTTLEEMQKQFEGCVLPGRETTVPIFAQNTLTKWPDKQRPDVASAYVVVAGHEFNMSGDEFNEAVIVIVA